jgi:DNA-binding GntR family transcriptional regulator
MLMRRAIEIEVVAACASDMSERAIQQLAQNLAYQRAAVDSGDVQGLHELDTSFHRRQLADGLNLVRVNEVLDPVRTHLERVRRTLLPQRGRMQGTLIEHRAIHSAIAKHQVTRAREAMANHRDRVWRELQAFVARNPGFFEN